MYKTVQYVELNLSNSVVLCILLNFNSKIMSNAEQLCKVKQHMSIHLSFVQNCNFYM